MRLCTIVLTILVTPLLCGAGSTKVYHSKDAAGNTVFSDMPSAGAEMITVTPTNSADPVEPIPALDAPDDNAQPAQQTSTLTNSPAQGEGSEDPDYWISNGGNDLDDRENGLRDRETGRETPITERPRVNPLPGAARPANGGDGRR